MREIYLFSMVYVDLRKRIMSGAQQEVWVALFDVGREPFPELVDALCRAAAATCILTGRPDVTRVMLVLGSIGRIWPDTLYWDLD